MLSEEVNSPFLGTLAALFVGAAAVAGTPNASIVMITAVTARMSLPRAPRPPRVRRRDEAPGVAVLWRWPRRWAGNDSKASWFGLVNVSSLSNETIQEVTCVLQSSRRPRPRWHRLPEPARLPRRWDLVSTSAPPATTTTTTTHRRRRARARMDIPAHTSMTDDLTWSCACLVDAVAAVNSSIGTAAPASMLAATHRTCANFSSRAACLVRCCPAPRIYPELPRSSCLARGSPRPHDGLLR